MGANYQVMPDLSVDEYSELKADIQARGVMVPIEYDEHGNVLDGHHRLKICFELGITEYPKVIRAGMTEAEKRTHARKLNMARRHLTQEQRRGLIREQLRETPEKSDRQIAASLGVTNKTVGAQRRELEETEEIPQFKTNIGADGKERPRQVERKPAPPPEPSKAEPIPEPLKAEPVQQEQAHEPPRPPVSIFNPTPKEEKAVKNPAVVERMRDVGVKEATLPHVSFNSGNNEWYTPAEYIEAARAVMGSIDLDPASSEIANKVVKAARFFTAETDGLKQEWAGSIWLNPPYSSDLIGKFAQKVADGGFSQAVVLVNNATETEWFEKIVGVSSAVCFPRSRVKFHKPDGSTGAPLQGQAVLYIGENPKLFVNVFWKFGWCAYLNEL